MMPIDFLRLLVLALCGTSFIFIYFTIRSFMARRRLENVTHISLSPKQLYNIGGVVSFILIMTIASFYEIYSRLQTEATWRSFIYFTAFSILLISAYHIYRYEKALYEKAKKISQLK